MSSIGFRLFSYVSGTDWLLWECLFFFPHVGRGKTLKS